MKTGDDDAKTTPFERDGQNPTASPYRRNAAPAPAADVAMFNHYKAAKQYKAPKWAAPLLISVAVFHVILFITMWAKSIWEIE